LRAVLASPLLARAPSLAQLLKFLCGKYFAEESATITEQQIAMEALGRSASFDQKRDSIVRVELHRLRKRLALYYQTEGAGHAVEISIPAGSYAPRFTAKVPAAGPAGAEVREAAAAPVRGRFHWRSLAARLGLLAKL
jgi:hypothetical protein